MKSLIQKSGWLIGCCISMLSPNQVKAQTTYKDVAPIFIANCTACHHTGGIQFPLTSFSAVQAMAPSIKADLQSGHMPPWPADPSYKHYVHERVISASDKANIIGWIDNGMLAGDTTLAPQAPAYGSYGLKGTPDLRLNAKEMLSKGYYQNNCFRI